MAQYNYKTASLLYFIVVVIVLAYLVEAKRIYIEPHPSTSKRSADVASSVGKIKREFPELGGYVVEVPDDFSVEDLRQDSSFAFVDDIPRAYVGGTPDDSYFSYMWHMTKLQMPQVWDLIPWSQTRTANISVGICDTGFDFTHPDVDGSRVIWQYDYYEDDNDVQDDSSIGHGVHVSGIIAAVTNNNLGVAGLSYGVNLMIGKLWGSNSTDGGSYDMLMACMTDLANAGARIINLSLGGTSGFRPLEQLINNLYSKGVLINSCAGNSYLDGNPTIYPAAYTNTFAVTNIQQNDTRFEASNTGSYIDIAAPGSYILSTVRGGGYEFWYGCSMATPVVSGLSALMLSVNPDLTAQELMDLFTSTAVDLGDAGKDSTFGYGRIDPFAAAQKLLSVNGTAVSSPTASSPDSSTVASPMASPTTTKTVISPTKSTSPVQATNTVSSGHNLLPIGCAALVSAVASLVW